MSPLASDPSGTHRTKCSGTGDVNEGILVDRPAEMHRGFTTTISDLRSRSHSKGGVIGENVAGLRPSARCGAVRLGTGRAAAGDTGGRIGLSTPVAGDNPCHAMRDDYWRALAYRYVTVCSETGDSDGRNVGQCIVLSTVVTAGKDGNPRHCSDAFSHMRQLAANCLVLHENLRIRLAGLCYDIDVQKKIRA